MFTQLLHNSSVALFPLRCNSCLDYTPLFFKSEENFLIIKREAIAGGFSPNPTYWALPLKCLDSLRDSKGYWRAGRCSSYLCFQSYFDRTRYLSLAKGSTSSKEFVPLPSLLSTVTVLQENCVPFLCWTKWEGEKLRAHRYILLGLRNKAKQKSKPKPLSFHPCLAMKVPSYLQACWQYFRMVHHTPSPLEGQTLSVLWDNYSLDCTSQRICIKHFYRKKIFEICESAFQTRLSSG